VADRRLAVSSAEEPIPAGPWTPTQHGPMADGLRCVLHAEGLTYSDAAAVLALTLPARDGWRSVGEVALRGWPWSCDDVQQRFLALSPGGAVPARGAESACYARRGAAIPPVARVYRLMFHVLIRPSR